MCVQPQDWATCTSCGPVLQVWCNRATCLGDNSLEGRVEVLQGCRRRPRRRYGVGIVIIDICGDAGQQPPQRDQAALQLARHIPLAHRSILHATR